MNILIIQETLENQQPKDEQHNMRDMNKHFTRNTNTLKHEKIYSYYYTNAH